MAKQLMDKTVVIGFDMTKFGDLYELGITDIADLAIHGALKSAKMNASDIDSLYVGNAMSGQFLGQENLGNLIATETGLDCEALKIEAAGASSAVALRVAAHAILSGYKEKVMVLGVEKMTSFTKMNEIQAALATGLDATWESSLGATLPANFAMMARAHIRKFGTTAEQLATVAIKNHDNARLNPRAQYKNKLRLESVLNSKMVADPIHLFESCAASDGAAAIILTSPEVAESYVKEPVYMRTSFQGHDKIQMYNREKLWFLESVKRASDLVYSRANITAKDISFAEVHDVFTIAEIMAIEALGLVPVGEGGKATVDGVTSLNGEIPINPSGGLKARGYPIGAAGIAQVIEIMEQFNNLAGKRQLKDINYALTQSLGGAGGTAVVSLFSR